MAISQLADRCWVLRPEPVLDDRGDRHYDTEAEAKDDASVGDRPPTAEQLPALCWTIQCGGDCEVTLDLEDEGWVFHCPSRADAEKTAADYGWIVTRAGEVFCAEDAPDCSAADLAVTEQVPGQLTLGGALGDDGTCPSCGSPDPAERAYVPGGTGMPVECSSDWHDEDAGGPGRA